MAAKTHRVLPGFGLALGGVGFGPRWPPQDRTRSDAGQVAVDGGCPVDEVGAQLRVPPDRPRVRADPGAGVEPGAESVGQGEPVSGESSFEQQAGILVSLQVRQ